MKDFKVTGIRWANWGDLELPLFKLWNKDNPLPPRFWQRIWEYPFLVSHVPKNSSCLDVGGTYPFVLFKNFPQVISVGIRNLNASDHPLHKGLWPTGQPVTADAHTLPFKDDMFDFSFCISALEEMSDPLSVVQEILRVTREKVVITIDISETLGMPWEMLTKLSRLLRCRIPPVPSDRLISSDARLHYFGMAPKSEYEHIRVLGIVIEDDEPTHRTCGIIIPHWESYQFLQMSIKKVKENKNDMVPHHIYIVDDDSKDGSFEKIQESWGNDPDVTIMQAHRPNKDVPDVGSLLDIAVQKVKERYVCTIDADVFPISPHWLSFPIHLIEKYDCASVGSDVGLSLSYLMLSPRCPGKWQNRDGYLPGFSLFDNENFTCTNNFYRVMKSSLAKIASEQVGYARRVALPSAIRQALLSPVSQKVLQRIPMYVQLRLGQLFYMALEPMHRARRVARSRRHGPQASDDWFPQGCDNGVAANYFIDVNKLGPKFSIPITSWVGGTPRDGPFGQNLCGLIFHFALSTRALSRFRREVADAGPSYARYAQDILTTGFTDELLDQLLSQCIFRDAYWDFAGGRPLPLSWYAAAKESFDQEFQIYLETVGGK